MTTYGNNWAIDIGGERVYFLPGAPWNKTAGDAELCWREATKCYFLPVAVRRTTPDEDLRLGNVGDALNNTGKR